MPTLFRLMFVLGIVFTLGYGTLYGIASLVKPEPRLIVEAVALPVSVTEIHTGRSAAEVLDHRASALVQNRSRSTKPITQ